MTHAASLQLLAAADTRLRAAVPRLFSLCPGRARATPLVEIGERLLDATMSEEVGQAFATAVVAMAEAQSASFPQNLFWDFDYPAACLLRQAAADPAHSGRRVHETRSRIVELQAVFGAQSPVQFRYAHDFIYGFDWARWVERDAASRRGLGPFGLEFLDYMLRRGRELLELVRRGGDRKYPPLPRGVARNPFGFSREPEAEERLHRDLAEHGLLPVEAWRIDAEPKWDRPYRVLREERAQVLGLAC